MWNEYRSKPSTVACRLVKGEVCVKYSYKFNGASELRSTLIEIHIFYFVNFTLSRKHYIFMHESQHRERNGR